MKKIKHNSRKFLNKSEGMASIEVISSVESWAFESQVSISDCSRLITLDFTAYSNKDFKSKVDKLDLIITELSILKQFMLDNKTKMEEIFAKKLKASDIEPMFKKLND